MTYNVITPNGTVMFEVRPVSNGFEVSSSGKIYGVVNAPPRNISFDGNDFRYVDSETGIRETFGRACTCGSMIPWQNCHMGSPYCG